MKASQLAVEELKEEQLKLRPIVEADKQIVEALFQIQADKQNKDIWLERAIAFFIGIASSIAGSLFWAYIRRKNV